MHRRKPLRSPRRLRQVAVRGANEVPAGDRAFSHVVREGAAVSRIAARGQARKIITRSGDERLADEIEDVGKSEKRELARRVAVLFGSPPQVEPPAGDENQQLALDNQRSAPPGCSRSRKRLASKRWSVTAIGERTLGSEPALKRSRRQGLRRTTCLSAAPGRWIRRPTRSSGRSDELLRPELLIHGFRKTPRAARWELILVKFRLNRRFQTRRSVSPLHRTIGQRVAAPPVQGSTRRNRCHAKSVAMSCARAYSPAFSLSIPSSRAC